MTNENLYQIAIRANLEGVQLNIDAMNENEMLMGEYMIPPVMEGQSSIVHPAFGQANFHPRTNMINMFQNAIQFFSRPTESSNAHIS